VVLDADQVLPKAVDQARGLEHPDRVADVGSEDVAELEWVCVVHWLSG
jgi:hypothetical protein